MDGSRCSGGVLGALRAKRGRRCRRSRCPAYCAHSSESLTVARSRAPRPPGAPPALPPAYRLLFPRAAGGLRAELEPRCDADGVTIAQLRAQRRWPASSGSGPTAPPSARCKVAPSSLPASLQHLAPALPRFHAPRAVFPSAAAPQGASRALSHPALPQLNRQLCACERLPSIT